MGYQNHLKMFIYTLNSRYFVYLLYVFEKQSESIEVHILWLQNRILIHFTPYHQLNKIDF